MEKIVPLKQLQQTVKGWKLKGDSIVFTNGCFDLMHAGHLEILLAAASQGNRLVVGLNSDASIKKLKGEERPVLKEEERALMLAAQAFVDAVIIFNEETPINLIETIRPDVLVKGGDYTEDEIVGAGFVKSNQGKVVIIPLLDGFSTTTLINRIKNLSN